MAVPVLNDVKTQLNITSSQYDELLNVYLNSALKLIEAHVGPSSVQTFTEQIETRSNGINLSYRPVQSVVSCDPLLNTWPSFVTADISFDSRSGSIWRKDLGTLAGAWNVTYTAGWPTFPDNYYLATLITVQHLWRTQRGASSRPSMGGSDELQISAGLGTVRTLKTGSTLSLPAAALELIGDSIYFGGIA